MNARLPLRWQLLAVLFLLLLLAFVGSAIAAPAAMESYLVSQVDTRVKRAAQGAMNQVDTGSPRPRPTRPGQAFGAAPQVLPSDFVMLISNVDGSPAGQVIRSTANGERPGEPDLPRLDSVRLGEPFTVGPAIGDHDWRVVVQRAGEDQYLVVAAGLEDVESTVTQSRVNILIIGGFALVLLLGLGYLLVRRSFRPLEQVERTAAEIADGDLSRRVPVDNPHSEVGRLGSALNTMLGQIESAFRARESSEAAARSSEERMRRFVADASHELRSPLTSIRGYAELYRQGAVTGDAEISHALQRIEDEAARMGLLVDDLLLLARLDQQRPLRSEEVDLVVVVVDAVEDARAGAGGRTIGLDVSGGPLTVRGDEARLRQVVANLLNNAVRHTPDDASVHVGLSTVDNGWFAEVEVADTGNGLAPEQAERVFERFYRASPGRSRDDGGAGLGLAIVAALVAAHGGTVGVESRPGEGATFRVRLPLV
ncbi:two-component system OmpR family sensor kinase [Herbihabitans rhizosphaerae]|uniref:histidine kinase n=1 Tax=Herbihabitans rhizosphaerae TaxID=1872711 RepID=A0A4Q7KMZ9_9PSEU|nr:HAMP domain-containing sensor histidine kinase [Herbihabitans rhizosphaerae]RZS37855.1 two-component system OmpR family sensor kinase [Herbihabitans rhizosphaerae]